MTQAVEKKQLKITHYHKFYRKFEHIFDIYTIKSTKKSPAVAIYRGNFCQKKFAGKELDTETGLYYYGARYLDPKASRWLSGDPAVSEYIPSAPVSEEARKRNGNLPGMGGVFNYVNLHVYHYAGNNPVKYRDPDGKRIKINEWDRGRILEMINSVSLYKFDVDSEGYLYRVENEVNIDQTNSSNSRNSRRSWSFSKQLQEGINSGMTIYIDIGDTIRVGLDPVEIEGEYGGGVTTVEENGIQVKITGRDSPYERPLVGGGERKPYAKQILVHELTVHAIPLVCDKPEYLENENSVNRQMGWPEIAPYYKHYD